jgi:putative DNA primase/helicase
MREDFWEFDPTHKIILCTNHQPRVQRGGQGMWRRLRLVPFTVSFWDADDPDAVKKGLPERLKQDKQLNEKLRAELPGILNWLVQGCLEWQHGGLQTPAAVLAATEDYKNSENAIARFVAERCGVGAEFKVKASAFRAALSKWWEDTEEGEPPAGKTLWAALSEVMQARNAPLSSYANNGTWYRGIMLLSTPSAGQNDPFAGSASEEGF